MREPVRDPKTIAAPEAQPKTDEVTVLEQTEGGRSLNEVHQETALQQVRQLRNHLEVQKKHLESSRGTIRKLFDQVRDWWKKEEGLETAVARLAIEMDHAEDKIKHATPEQLNQHLQPELSRLQQQIEKIQLASVEVNQFVESQTEHSVETNENFPMEAAGGMKDWKGNIVEKSGKLGKYGQDVLRANPELGIGVVADGTSSALDSFETARLVSRRAQDILEDIPVDLCSTVQELEFFLEGELNGLLEEIRQLPETATGATTLLAARYIEKFDTVLMIDIGDCEIVAVSGDKVVALKPALEHSNQTDSVVKGYKTLRKDGKPITNKYLENETSDWDNKPLQPKDFIKESTVHFKRETDRPFVRSVSLTELRAEQTDRPIHILLASDGLQNNTGKTLEQQAQEIIAKGVKATVAEAGTAKDDISILDMTIPLKEERKEAAA